MHLESRDTAMHKALAYQNVRLQQHDHFVTTTNSTTLLQGIEQAQQ